MPSDVRTALLLTLIFAQCVADDEPAAPRRTVEAVIAAVTGPTEYPPNLSGEETEVELRYVGFTPRAADRMKLLAAFRDPRHDLTARLCVASYLAKLGDADARTLLQECLDGKHVEKSLDEAVDPPTLRVALDSPEKVKQNAVYAIMYIGRFDRQLPGDAWEVQQMMRIVRDEVVPPNSRAFLDTCQRLGRTKNMQVVDVLIDVVRRYPNAYEPVLALGEIGDDRAEEILLKTVESRSRLPRAQAFALYKLKSKQLVPILARHLNDDVALSLLVESKDPRAVEPLRKFIADGNDSRGQARLTLARIESKDDRELATRLIELLQDPALADIHWQIVDPLAATRDPRAVKPLVSVGRTCTDDLVWSHVIEALETIGGEAAIEGLILLLERDFATLNIGGKPPYREPKTEILAALKNLTGKQLGDDPAKWRAWLEESR